MENTKEAGFNQSVHSLTHSKWVNTSLQKKLMIYYFEIIKVATIERRKFLLDTTLSINSPSLSE